MEPNMKDDDDVLPIGRRKCIQALTVATAGATAGCMGGGNDGSSNDGSSDGNDGSSNGGSSDNWQENTEVPLRYLTWNHGHFDDWLPGWFDSFEEEYGVEAEWLDRPASDVTTYVQTQFQADSPPHAIDMQSSSWVNFARQGAFTPVNDYVPQERIDLIPDATREFLTIDGDLYGLPHFQNMAYTYGRKQWLDAMGIDQIPQTTEELLNEAERAVNETDAEYGFVLVRYGFILWSLFANEDIQIVEDGEVGFQTDRTVEILDRLYQLTEDGVIPEVSWTSRKEEQINQMGSGNTAMGLFNGSGYRGILNSGDWVSSETLRLFNVPGAPSVVHALFFPSVYDEATITGATQLALWTLNEENQTEWNRKVPNPVSRTDVLDSFASDDEWEEWRDTNPILTKQINLMQTALEEGLVNNPPKVDGSSEMFDIINTEFTSAALGEQSAQEAVDSAAQEVENILNG
jgi:ABC-type glycerol-3-phosphate transport system substrate-binding protein